MSSTPATPAKLTLWQKIEHDLKIGIAVEENIALAALPDLQKYAPVVAKMVSDILTAQVNMQAAIAAIPGGISKAQKSGLVIGVIGSQVALDAATFGKQLTTDNINVINDLVEQIQAEIANASTITTAPTVAQVTAAETAANIITADTPPAALPA